MPVSRQLVLMTMAAVVTCFIAPMIQTANAAEQSESKKTQIERGKHLSYKVAMCVYCHSPRSADNQIIESRAFTGAPLPIAVSNADLSWGTTAPNLRSISQIWGEDGLSKFLQTGVTPRGPAPKLPMPPYRMDKEEADAIAAYLGSLK